MSECQTTGADDLRQLFINQSYKVAIIASRYNKEIVQRMLAQAIKTCKLAGIAEKALDIHWVSGALEIPQIVATLIKDKQRKPDAAICLGCIVKGETEHNKYIAQAIYNKLVDLACDHDLPMGVGILTTINKEQAEARAGGSRGNKGVEATISALEILNWKIGGQVE